ncbi:MAG: hypothetical protein ACI9I4_000879 [Neolewinella sp.]|jgi:hypothetical protein
MKRSLLLTIAALFAFMAGCGDSSDTSLETGGTSLAKEKVLTLPSGALINIFFDDSGVIGTAIRVNVQMRSLGSQPGDTAGTLDWGDKSTTRVIDDNTVLYHHIYSVPGIYLTSIQIDGDDKVSGFTVAISAAPVVAPSAAVAVVPPPPGRFADFTCDPVSGTPQSLTDSAVLSLPDSFSPPAYFIASVTLLGPACSLPYGPLATNPGPGDSVGGRPSEFGCAVGDVFTISYTSLDGPSTAECSWPVIP